MKDKLVKPGTNFWFIIGTIIFFVLSYLFYFQLYIPNKESKIIATRFRVLDQMGDNVNAKVNSYQRNALTFNNKIEKEAKSIASRLKEEKNKEYSQSLIVQYLLDELTKGNYKKFFNKDVQLIYYKLDGGDSSLVSERTYASEFKNNIKETDKYYFLDPITTNISDESKKADKDSVVFGVKYENIMQGLTRNDVFDHIFIIEKDKVIYSTLKSDLILDIPKDQENNRIVSLASRNKTWFGNNDDTQDVKTGTKLISGEYSEISISNEEYKLFFKPVKVKGIYWYIGGLVKTENFHAAARSIDQWIIILLSLIIILIVLGLPLIKLKVISKTDELKTGSIINSALSLLLGTSFFTLFILYLSQSLVHHFNTDEKLMELSAEIDSSFTEEITNAMNQLATFDSEYIKIKREGNSVGGVFENILDPAKSDYVLKEYPFADYIFWLNDLGRQTEYLTPFRKTSGELSNLAHRDYFSKSDEWFFPPDPDKKFRLESIVSITSGNHKVAFSTPSRSRFNPVVALTAQFYSLIDPILPRSYGFCIIDDEGKVWFHSNKERNLMENFISECNDDKELKAAFYNRTSILANVNYYNKPHRVYTKPLKDLPLFLVTFYSKNTDTSFQAQIFTVTLIFIGLFFLLIVVQIALILILDRFFLWKIMRNLLLNITRPRLYLKSQNRFLIQMYILILFASAIVISFMPGFQAFAAIFVLELIVFVFSFWVLNDNDLKRRQLWWFSLINLAILALLNIAVFNIVKFADGRLFLMYEISLIVFLLASYWFFKQRKANTKYVFNKAFIRTYALLLVCFALFFSIFPTLVFYEIAYNEESVIQTRHYQVDAMKKREIRNAKWSSYYKSLTDVEFSRPILEVLQERKNKGIYLQFNDDLEYLTHPDSTITNDEDFMKSNVFDKFVTLLRPYYSDEIIEDKFLLYNDQNNASTSWLNLNDSSMVLKYLSNTEDPFFNKQETVLIRAKADRVNFLTPFHGESFRGSKKIIYNVILWIFFLLTLFIFYYLIRFAIRNVFSIDILLNYYPEPFGKLVTQYLLANGNLFIVKQSNLEESDKLLEDINFDVMLDWHDPHFVEQADQIMNEFIENNKATEEPEDDPGIETKSGFKKTKNPILTFFIDKFELEYEDADTLNKKLNKLLTLIKQRNYKVIILSSIHLQKVLSAQNNGDDNTNEKLNGGISDLIQYKNNMNLLETLLNNVLIKHLPVKSSLQKEFAENGQRYGRKKLDINDLIDLELDACDYLKQYRKALDNYKESLKKQQVDNPEELILNKINEIARNYYEEIFNSCTAEEQYLIFDLADDLLVNQKNREVVYGLLEKGILIKKIDRISFMNVSFRRFVLSIKDKSRIKELEGKIGKESSPWKGYRIVLILIVVSIFIFIAMANQDLMKNINQLIIMIGASLASLTGLLGAITGKKNSANR